MDELELLRQEIDDIDGQLVNLVERRMDAAVKVAEYKKKNGIEIYNGKRESEVIQKNVKKLKNKNYEITLRRFFLTLMELSRDIQKQIMDN